MKRYTEIKINITIKEDNKEFPVEMILKDRDGIFDVRAACETAHCLMLAVFTKIYLKSPEKLKELPWEILGVETPRYFLCKKSPLYEEINRE